MMQAARRNFVARHWLSVSLAGLAVAAAAGSTAALWAFFSSAPTPDPTLASNAEIAGFVGSKDFLDMPSEQRSAFVNGVMDRYMEMSPEDQAAARAELDCIHAEETINEKAATFWVSLLLKFARDSRDLPPDQREQKLDRMAAMMENFGGQRATDAIGDLVSGGSRGRRSRWSSYQGFVRTNESLLQRTTAEDRALMARAVADMARRMKRRFGQR